MYYITATNTIGKFNIISDKMAYPECCEFAIELWQKGYTQIAIWRNDPKQTYVACVSDGLITFD